MYPAFDWSFVLLAIMNISAHAISVGDQVLVEMSPYDTQRGRISFRHRSGQTTSTATTGQRRAQWRRRG